MRDTKTIASVKPSAPAWTGPLAPTPTLLTIQPGETAGPDEALRAQQVRRAQAYRERTAALRWSLLGAGVYLASLLALTLIPGFWPIWLIGCQMGATAALIGRATGREAQAAMRAADQEIAQLQRDAQPALPPAAAGDPPGGARPAGPIAQSPSSSR